MQDYHDPIPPDEYSFKDLAAQVKPPAKEAPPVAATVPDSANGAVDEPEAEETANRGNDAASEAVPANLTGTGASPRHQLEAWLALMIRDGASDLILRAGGRPSLRVDGKVGFVSGRVPGSGALLEILEGILGSDRLEAWRATGSVDAALHLDGLGRFRMNAYKQMGEPAVVIRRISEDAPNIDMLNLPDEELKKLSLRRRGLILVTGLAGAGKSTTLASMIQYMNRMVERHVITLEDPIELIFNEDQSVISQREVGTDCESFHDGLKHALRQSPDVILIGEMRDAETVTAALDAVETGHLVMSTLHTVNAPQTIDRILSFYAADAHAQVRSRLADNLAGILSQRLLPRCGDGGGMVPAYELMTTNPHVRELLAEGSTIELARVIEQSTGTGLVSFNRCLRRLVLERKVGLKDALAASDRPDELVLALRGITASSANIDLTETGRTDPLDRRDGGGSRPDTLRLS